MMLEISHIDKIFNKGTHDQRIALHDFNFSLEQGDFCCVIGCNGAGKSTLLNVIAGNIEADKGHITIDGKNVTSLSPHKRARVLARVFQDPICGTASEMSIAENLLLADLRADTKKMKWGLTGARKEKYQTFLKRLDLGLENRLNTRVKLLSGGQRQALSLLMAVMSAPKILLLDEHTAALDPKATALILKLTQEVITEYQLTTLMVTHDMQMAIDCGNRLMMMEDGKIIYQSSGETKKQHHVQQLVDKFHNKDNKLLLQ